ncbi:MAG TPA: hypothetical protein VLA52_07080, partial [Thermohalobaculum sp.]|nr:hypothetical protein [Thermohalobaculum sp.]
MSNYLIRNRQFALKNEATAGVEETIDPAADAIQVEDPVPTPNFELLETNEAGASLDGSGSIVGGGNFGFTGRAYFKGQGSAGSAPKFGRLLRSAACSETLTAADETGTAQAGAAGTITLAAGASATDDNYNGMVIETTGGTGSGQTRVIYDYNGTTKVASITPAWTTTPDATTTYAIRANALYKPITQGQETATGVLWDNAVDAAINSLRRRVIGACAEMTLNATVRGLGAFDWTLTGILPANPDNVAAPAAPSFDATRPRPLVSADAFLDNAALKFNAFSLTFGNTVQQADDPAALYGFGVARVTSRKATGTINPNLDLLSTRNA